MDILDKADEAQDAFMRAAISKVPAPTVAAGIGACLNCGVEVEGDARWCSAECRDDWEKYGRR